MSTAKDQIDMFGPTSLRKIEREAFEAGIDLFGQYDDNDFFKVVGEGSRDNPYVVATRNQGK